MAIISAYANPVLGMLNQEVNERRGADPKPSEPVANYPRKRLLNLGISPQMILP
ncbi:MAG: hypothetical protein K9W42_00035 [Candidatus Heimdallarchaeota archaeon]|nr:hypothetical protein [Candidatus Heimdallarchaeota archaeon]